MDVDAKTRWPTTQIFSADTEEYIYAISSQLSDACGAQIGVYTVEEALGNTTMEGFAYNVFTAWELGSADQDNGVLLLLALARRTAGTTTSCAAPGWKAA